MIDLSGFSPVSSRKARGGSCYIKRLDGAAKLVMDSKTAADAVKYFGHEVGVLVDYATGRVVLTRGNDRRICTSGSCNVSLGNEAPWLAAFGQFSRIYEKPTWESDSEHRKVLLFTPDGKPEMAEDMTVRKLVDRR